MSETMTVTLPSDLAADLREAVAAGEYPDAYFEKLRVQSENRD